MEVPRVTLDVAATDTETQGVSEVDVILAAEAVDLSATSATGLVKSREGERKRERKPCGSEREIENERERLPNYFSYSQIFTFDQVWPLCPGVQGGGGPLLQVSRDWAHCEELQPGRGPLLQVSRDWAHCEELQPGRG